MSRKTLAQLAAAGCEVKIRDLEEALDCSFFTGQHAFILAMMLASIDYLTAQVSELTARIEVLCEPYARQIAQLDQIPGFGIITAQDIIAETGTDMTVFATAGHLCSWAWQAPQVSQSAGKRKGKTASVRTRCPKSGGDDDAAELGGHVGGRGLGLAGVPGGAGPVICHVGGVVAGGGVPAGGDGLAGELERDGPLDRAGGAVAGLPGAEDLPGVFDRDLDRPPAGVSLDHLRGGGGGIGGDQGQVIAGRWPVADQHDGDGPGAQD